MNVAALYTGLGGLLGGFLLGMFVRWIYPVQVDKFVDVPVPFEKIVEKEVVVEKEVIVEKEILVDHFIAPPRCDHGHILSNAAKATLVEKAEQGVSST